MIKGVMVYLGRYHSKERARVAAKLYKYWVKRGYDMSPFEADINSVERIADNYYGIPQLTNIYMRINKDFSLSFGYSIYHKKKRYSNYGYNSLDVCVKAFNNKLKLLINR